jgi:hypothetical protein
MATYSREYLRGLPEKHRKDMIINEISFYHPNITNAARSGKLYYKIDLTEYLRRMQQSPGCYPPPYRPTIDDIVEGLKELYLGCRVEYIKDWIETKPGIKEQKEFILVDWS